MKAKKVKTTFPIPRIFIPPTQNARQKKCNYVLYLYLWVLSSISLTRNKLKKGYSLALKSTVIPRNNAREFSCSIVDWLDSWLNCDCVWKMGWEEVVTELGVSTRITESVWSCGTEEVGRGILRETTRSSDMGPCPRWDSCSSIFDVFMRCAGVGTGMLDENASLEEPGSGKETSGRSEGEHRWALDDASPFSKPDASAATLA
jgi:hypothetical protein